MLAEASQAFFPRTRAFLERVVDIKHKIRFM